ncbi:ABC transporter family substrate-binding protein [Corynebacterium lubricantis]|uniref:ABC transporter family substrate-binding protein n=1 Tax=Corynebacterium lubricantis TaxID=541095 RepID=UPI00036AB3E8|nr:ABC transporter family substrate-binding protein [Corynebacterium lubricantis]
MKRRFSTLVATLLTAGVVVSGCAANPGPPPVVEPTPTTEPTTTETTTTQARPARTEAAVGVEPLRNGFNPHLLSDDSSVVRSLANLVLPSAFLRGQLNRNLLRSAEVIEPVDSPGVVMTVRYVIQDAAQWSDGTPITGSDFAYLWQGMSTSPGVINPEGYRAISNVRVIGGGAKTVEVDFHAPVADWQSLFSYLLPAHLLDSGEQGFLVGLRDNIPASAGRYLVNNVDRARGVITLNRNDRFWGPEPAQIDILSLVETRSTTHSADQLRAGQLQFVDVLPGETTRDTYELIPDIQNRLVQSQRQLGLTLSTNSPILSDHATRVELSGLVDVPLIARLGAGRSTDLIVADSEPVNSAEPELLRSAIESAGRPLRIAADPADATASASVRSLVDLLKQRGINAEVVSTDLTDLTKNRLPSGDVDAVIAREWIDGSPNYVAGALRCPDEETGMRSGNLSGLCMPETEGVANQVLAGEISPERAQELLDEFRTREATWVPLLREQRILALSPGIIGPDPDLEEWTDGLATADTWRLPDEADATTTTTTPPNIAEEEQQF